jgi:hypothetical protein
MSILAKALHIAIIASAISSTLIVSAATPATVENISSPQTICDGANVNDYWYVGEVRYPRDHFFGDNNYDWAFGLKSSKVQIYSPSNMLSVTGGFNWRSNGKPQGVNEVIIMQNDGGSQLTSHPSSPNVLAGQIVYQINRLYSYELI